jgi:hypothetical protein
LYSSGLRLPDPLELSEIRQEHLIEQWGQLQKNVPDGCFRCPECMGIFDYSPIPISGDPDSPVCCYDCLSPEMQEAYDKFFGN